MNLEYSLPTMRTSHLVKALGSSAAGAPGRGMSDDPAVLSRIFGNFVVPRFEPAVWHDYMLMNTRLKSALEELATASVGLGISGIPDPEELELLGDLPARNRRKELLDAAKRLTRFCRRPKAESFLPLQFDLVRAEVDFNATGFFCLEVMEERREAGGPIIGLGHLRSAQMRIDPRRERWVQGVHFSAYNASTSDETGTWVPASSVSVQANYYRVFGDADPAHRFINRKTGQFYAEWPAGLNESLRGHAVISGSSYNPVDPYYGLPIHASALYAILENDLMAKFMMAFLQKGTRVPLLFLVEKGQLTPDSMEKIEAIFNSDTTGLDSAGRAAVIQPNVQGMFGQQATIRVERVELGISDFAPLFTRRDRNDGEILETTRMSGLFLGGGEGSQQTTRNAGVLKQVGQEHAIEPRTQFWEALLSNGLAPNIAPGATFRVRRPRNLDPVQVASIMAKMKDFLTVSDGRGALRELLSGINIPTLVLGPDGQVPMAQLRQQFAMELEQASVDPPAEPPANVRKLSVA